MRPSAFEIETSVKPTVGMSIDRYPVSDSANRVRAHPPTRSTSAIMTKTLGWW